MNKHIEKKMVIKCIQIQYKYNKNISSKNSNKKKSFNNLI